MLSLCLSRSLSVSDSLSLSLVLFCCPFLSIHLSRSLNSTIPRLAVDASMTLAFETELHHPTDSPLLLSSTCSVPPRHTGPVADAHCYTDRMKFLSTSSLLAASLLSEIHASDRELREGKVETRKDAALQAVASRPPAAGTTWLSFC